MCARHTHKHKHTTNTYPTPGWINVGASETLTGSHRFSPVLTGDGRGSVGLTPPVACLAAVSGLPVVLLPGEQRTEARCPCGAEQGVEPRPRQTQDQHHDKLLEMHSTRGLQSDLQHPSESFSFVALSYIFLY